MNENKILFNKKVKANIHTKHKVIANSNVAEYLDSIDVELVTLNCKSAPSKKLGTMVIEQMVAKKYGATPGRKRPRNPKEKEILLRWERERDGEKIGTI